MLNRDDKFLLSGRKNISIVNLRPHTSGRKEDSNFDDRTRPDMSGRRPGSLVNWVKQVNTFHDSFYNRY